MTGTPSSPSARIVSRYSSTGGWYSWGEWGWAKCSVMAMLGRGGHVERGVAVEEAEREQREAGGLDGHHRPVLGSRDMRHAEGMPQHDVGVDHGPVARGPRRQPGAAGVLVWVVARRPPLFGG